MARITFYGAAGTVTGSRHALSINGHQLLIDCGMFQGSKQNRLKNWEPFPVEPASFDRVLLTHAHIDHSGYLPRFCRDGFQGKIHCTHATADLCEILLKDSAHIQEEDAAWANKKGYSRHKPALPLYTVADAEAALEQFAPVNYGEGVYLDESLRFKLKDAGHILGAAVIDIRSGNGAGSKKILFSGDVGRPDDLLLREPVQVYDVDYLVLESTYGNRLHEDGTPREELMQVINASAERGGVLVIPSFAVGRTQTLLYVIRELEEAGKIPSLPVFVDSPMAIDATGIFRRRISELNLHARILSLQEKRIFHPKQLRLAKSREDSKAINGYKGNAIIIAASGMVTGGRILHHLEQRLPDKKNTILFVGYQAEGTRGRTILNGSETVKLHGQQVPIRAHIENISGFSGHADYNEMLAWLMGFNRPPHKTFLVHGEPEAASAFAEKIREAFSWDVIIPQTGESYELDI